MKPLSVLMACVMLVSAADAGQLELDKKWIMANMNRATTTITFRIKEAKKSVNPISSGAQDGDLHIAGNSVQVGLPMVAEIVNARQSMDAVQFAQQHPGQDVPITGVWRLWFEHPPNGKQKQFANNPITGQSATNPDHMFEIHPITAIGSHDLKDNLIRVQGYEAKSNVDTFKNYETRMIDSWKVTGTSVIIESKRAGYNYADFVVRLEESPTEIAEEPGRYMARAEVLDTNCKVIASNGKPVVSGPRRMVFVEKDASAVIGKAKPGAAFHVMGIPRINLERLTYFLNHPNEFNNKRVFLPYEMVIISAEAQSCPKK